MITWASLEKIEFSEVPVGMIGKNSTFRVAPESIDQVDVNKVRIIKSNFFSLTGFAK
jgi:hypothetical protein